MSMATSSSAVRPGSVIDSRMEDVDHASHLIPFNLSIGRKLLNTPLHGSTPAATFDKKDITALQGDISDYVSSLDTRLRGLFAHSNDNLEKRIRSIERSPALLTYFQLQQQMLELSGDLSTRREKEMLTKLAHLVDS